MIYGYCRVSTKHQNLQRQIDALVKHGINQRFIFTDKYTGKTLDREGLNELLTILKPGDTLAVKGLASVFLRFGTKFAIFSIKSMARLLLTKSKPEEIDFLSFSSFLFI